MDRLQRRFRVTHPFHPRAGETFALVGYGRNWGHERVEGLDSGGKLFTVPLSWTDAAQEDSFRALLRGRSYGHVRELLGLAELLEDVQR